MRAKLTPGQAQPPRPSRRCRRRRRDPELRAYVPTRAPVGTVRGSWDGRERGVHDFSGVFGGWRSGASKYLSLIHISEPTRRTPISYAVFCLKKKKKIQNQI